MARGGGIGGLEEGGEQLGYNFNCTCKVCEHHLDKIKYREQFEWHDMELKDKQLFLRFVQEELDEDGKPVRTARAIQAELAKFTAHKMPKRTFGPGFPGWQDISRPTYKLNNVLGGDSPKIDYLKDVKMQNTSSNIDCFKKKETHVYVERSYNWLMVHLLSHNEKIQGCEVNIPEQVLFFDQKPKYFLKNDKDGCVMQFNKSKTEKADVRAHFGSLGVERRKNQAEDFALQSH